MGVSIITKGIVSPSAISIIVNRVYYPLKININKQRPTIIIRNINTKVNITISPYNE